MVHCVQAEELESADLEGIMTSDETKVKAPVETMADSNLVLTEAIFQLLEEKGLTQTSRSQRPGREDKD